ncbi:hypothetical protein ACFO4E_08190 [Nocardiopsis mangrovi]|uniref:Uncharacterized protein n=1 Tax=Nocardiopsis mangrovi TaxID=1179818 RepID=A0ABV9DSG7_9ACTN
MEHLTALLRAFIRAVWPPHTGTRVRNRQTHRTTSSGRHTTTGSRCAPEPTTARPHRDDELSHVGRHRIPHRFADRTQPLPRTPIVDAPGIDPLAGIVGGHYRAHERRILEGVGR